MRILTSISRRVVPPPEALFAAENGASTSPIQAWAWNTNVVGFGTKYSDPSSYMTSTATGVAVRPGNTDVASTANGNSYLRIYPWSFYGFGTAYSVVSPGSIPNGVNFSSTGNTIALATTGSPYISAYPFTTGTGLGTKYANPATSLTSAQNSIGWRTSGAVATTQDVSPYLYVYRFTEGTGWGTQYGTITSPSAALITGPGYDAKFSRTGAYLAVAHLNSPYLHTYNWSTSTGFTAYWFNPATLPSDGTTSITWHPTTNNMVFTVQAISGIAAYEGTEDYGIKFANPVGVNSFYLSGTFSKDGTTFAAGSQGNGSTSWGIDTWAYTADVGFGSKYSNPPGTVTSTSYVLGLQFTK